MREEYVRLTNEKAALEAKLHDLKALKEQMSVVKQELHQKKVEERKRLDRAEFAMGNHGFLMKDGSGPCRARRASIRSVRRCTVSNDRQAAKAADRQPRIQLAPDHGHGQVRVGRNDGVGAGSQRRGNGDRGVAARGLVRPARQVRQHPDVCRREEICAVAEHERRAQCRGSVPAGAAGPRGDRVDVVEARDPSRPAVSVARCRSRR